VSEHVLSEPFARKLWPASLDRLSKALFSRSNRRAVTSFAVILALWQLESISGSWLGYSIPGVSSIPSPLVVFDVWIHLLFDPNYWESWYSSIIRVAAGFFAGVVVGVPFGLLMAVSKAFRQTFFPVFELLRPIPPLAWVPAAIIFWPTQELSIASVIFIGAFFTIVINVLGGAGAIDARFIQVARSMGGSSFNVFRRIILPGTLPSIFVGMEVGIGITWEVVVAAEMISGGGSGGTGGGLGFFIWNSYVGGSYPQIIVGMASIGIAGYLSSAMIRRLEKYVAPWLR
jgi:NitT/TauT family transport system permease protein